MLNSMGNICSVWKLKKNLKKHIECAKLQGHDRFPPARFTSIESSIRRLTQPPWSGLRFWNLASLLWARETERAEATPRTAKMTPILRFLLHEMTATRFLFCRSHGFKDMPKFGRCLLNILHLFWSERWVGWRSTSRAANSEIWGTLF